MQSHIEGSQRIMNALFKYSAGGLTPTQISKDFASESGPTIAGKQYANNGLVINGEYDYGSNTIFISYAFAERIERLLTREKLVPIYGLLDFMKLFVHEYTHYGDAIDGKDAILDDQGNVRNDPNASEPSFGDGEFEEGEAAENEVYPWPTGRQSYHFFKEGILYKPGSNEKIDVNEEYKDESMIPNCGCFGPKSPR